MDRFKIRLIILCFVLFGCQSSVSDQIDFVEFSASPTESTIVSDNYPELTDVYTPDMSGYSSLHNVQLGNFVGVSPSKFIEMINNFDTGVYLLASRSCGYCQEAIESINRALLDTGCTINYLDCDSQFYPLSAEQISQLFEVMYPILQEDSEGEKSILTPHVFVIKNDEFCDSQVGLTEGYDGTSSAKEALYLRYKDMMKELI